MAKNHETTHVQNPALLAVGARRDVLAYRQQSGVFRAMDNPRRIVTVGTTGLADCALIVKVRITQDMVGKDIGAAVQAEFKTFKKGSAQSEGQEDWQRNVEERGGIYQVVKSAQEMTELIDRVQRGDW